jgi:hypothetical protein
VQIALFMAFPRRIILAGSRPHLSATTRKGGRAIRDFVTQE